MDLFEYQARDLFESYGVPVLPGGAARATVVIRHGLGAVARPVSHLVANEVVVGSSPITRS